MSESKFTPEFAANIWAALGAGAQAEFMDMLEAWRECDASEPDVTDRFEALGLVRSVIATADDAAQPFAYEGGIIKGEPMWKLTESGQAVADFLRAALLRAQATQQEEGKAP